MKYRILERPSCEEGYDLVEEALRKKATIIIFACCKVNYEGRALSQLNWGERIILIKPDGSFLIHQERKVDPVNWQPPKSRTRSFIRNDKLILESHRRVPKELLSVEIRKIQFINYANVEDFEELEQAGYEKDMGDMIMDKPHLIEEGFTPTAREYSVEHGFIDILGKDDDNNLMVLELKARKAGVSAVKQLKRYLSDFENTENDYLKECKASKKRIRGLLVAPSLGEDAKEMIEDEGIEFVSIEPPKELRRDKKTTLDAF
ncbi:endonuclease NucS [Methanobrevibacter oralis]|uniref:Endonuclease NucS n=1 Tax=Methanobrevibacter oralis TaxID=66851 RepID=A0A162FMU1_METOA|nr:endonuclease NucS [Methanobrevibacter oralis]KZX12390.1 endonuclease NucS [Methanobrevibacter oralis]